MVAWESQHTPMAQALALFAPLHPALGSIHRWPRQVALVLGGRHAELPYTVVIPGLIKFEIGLLSGGNLLDSCRERPFPRAHRPDGQYFIVRRQATHTSPSTRSEAARRQALIFHIPHLRSCRSWPTADGHALPVASGSL